MTTIVHKVIHESFESYYSSPINNKTISIEQLLRFKISPLHYKYYLTSKDQQEEDLRTNKISAGIHCYMQDKDLFYAEFKCLKDTMLPAITKMGVRNYTLKENRHFRDVIFPKICKGKVILSEFEYDLIETACKPNFDNDLIRKVYSKGRPSVSINHTDDKTKLSLKHRLDWLPATLSNMNRPIFDIRISPEVHPNVYSKTIFQTGLSNRAAWSLELFNRSNFVQFAIEKDAPWVVQPFVLDDVIAKAKTENRMLLDILYWSKKNGYYANYAEFEILKTLYMDGECQYNSMERTMDVLNGFHEMNTGIYNVELPHYMK